MYVTVGDWFSSRLFYLGYPLYALDR
jgi:hypothetical protein